MIKLLYKITTIFLLLFLVVSPVESYSQLIIPDTSVSSNNILTLPVKILGTDSLRIFSYQFNLTYDTAFFELSRVIKNTDVNSLWGKPLINSRDKGIIRIAAASEKTVPVDGVLFYLSFFPKKAGKTVIAVKKLLFNEGNPPANYKNGNILIF